MATRSPSALLKALAAADLLEAALDPAAVALATAPSAGTPGDVMHFRYGCPLSRATPEVVPVPWVPTLRSTGTCGDPACVSSLVSPLGSVHTSMVEFLLAAHDRVRAAHRYLADPTRTTVAGKRRKLLASSTRDLERVSANLGRADVTGALAAAHERALVLVTEVVDLLDGHRADPQVRERVLERVRSAMTPARSPKALRLDDSSVLVGLFEHRGTSQKVQEVIDAVRVGGSDTYPALLAPRYVVDYLHSTYASGGSSSLILTSAPTTGVADEVVRAAVALWSPLVEGPLVNMSAALAAAADVIGA